MSPPLSDDDAMALRFEVAERSGDRVVVAERATIAVEDRVLVERFTGSVNRGDVLGLVGPNGAGKSTLIRALLGAHSLTSGELRLGSSVSVGYYRQDLSQVPLDKTLYQTIADLRPSWERRLIQGHLGRFGFSGDEVQRRSGTLSGGERARVALAMLMLSRANVLILDEPTNHLDVESIEALEDALERYDGTVILVSHDRELLRGLTTKLWLLHDRRITEFAGSFSEWEAVSAEREHAAAVRAAEEESLLRVRERQKLEKAHRADAESEEARSSRTVARDLRRAQRSLEDAEQEVATLEARVSELTTGLEDPDLYTRADGPAEAARLGAELDRHRAALDLALERWTALSETVESLVRQLTPSET